MNVALGSVGLRAREHPGAGGQENGGTGAWEKRGAVMPLPREKVCMESESDGWRFGVIPSFMGQRGR